MCATTNQKNEADRYTGAEAKRADSSYSKWCHQKSPKKSGDDTADTIEQARTDQSWGRLRVPPSSSIAAANNDNLDTPVVAAVSDDHRTDQQFIRKAVPVHENFEYNEEGEDGDLRHNTGMKNIQFNSADRKRKW